MSNYDNVEDKLRAHYDELKRKHKELDEEIEVKYSNVTVSEEVRRLKTMKLYLKDEMHRINAYLVQKGLE
jgi:uncharacterized protein YdcH (DUF465 family)|tara:strand:+ start:820 stop:1029 length:210 start_codon:yes stop_codon:yes gene_type:complete